jgi:hypothetical protein
MFDKYNDKDGCLAAVGMFLLMIILLAGLYLLEAWIGQWLWNDVVGMDTLFNLPELSFWQTYGLIWLAHIIFPNNTKWSSSKD